MRGYIATLDCCGGPLSPLEEHVTDGRNGGHAVYQCDGCGQRWRLQVFVNREGPTIHTFDPETARVRAGESAVGVV